MIDRRQAIDEAQRVMFGGGLEQPSLEDVVDAVLALEGPRSARALVIRYAVLTDTEAVSLEGGIPVTVELVETSLDLWAIRHAGRRLSRTGRWLWEGLPSARTEAFKAKTRFPLQEALRRAVAATDVLARRAGGR